MTTPPTAFLLALVLTVTARSQDVPATPVPDPRIAVDGSRVDADAWPRRRAEILELFREHVYGRPPAALDVPAAVVFESADDALGGKARRRQVRVYLSPAGADGPGLDLLVYLPTAATGPVPVFLGLNFYGNHTVCPDPAIRLTASWCRDNERFGVVGSTATEHGRGVRSSRWPVSAILARGYGLATAYYGDIDPDFDDGFANGVHGALDRGVRGRDAWGSIAAWAWGASRALDYLVTAPGVDPERVAVMGHSRLGKTALWAGAEDPRFALVVSNDSGCGGAALSRRRSGETVRRINASFPHWFCANFGAFDDREDELPVDQHLLIALIAPRPVYVASASDDAWADPLGEFLAAKGAEPVYRLLGAGNLPADCQPPVNTPVMGAIGYHLRAGAHDVTDYDWQRFMDFADRHLVPEK